MQQMLMHSRGLHQWDETIQGRASCDVRIFTDAHEMQMVFVMAAVIRNLNSIILNTIRSQYGPVLQIAGVQAFFSNTIALDGCLG